VTPGTETSVTYQKLTDASITWVVIFVIGATPTPTASSTPIPPWVQAYGTFHHDDACATGWTNSWQEWAEPVTGGFVCTRSIPSLG
jgi:hypothetical protein